MTKTTADGPATEPPATPPEAGDGAGRPSPLAPLRALAQGDLGSLRVLIGLAIIWTIFQLKVQDGLFLTSQNLSKLTLQIAAVGTISIGVVLILLLGEIDLSVGSVSGLCAAIMAVLGQKHGWAPVTSVLAGLGAGALIGLFHGFMVTFFDIPSFVVTLAGLIGWQGALLWVLGTTGTVGLPFPGPITNITNTFYSDAVGWVMALLVVGAFLATQLRERRKRTKAGLPPGDIRLTALRTTIVAVAVAAAVWTFNGYNGVPLPALILAVLVGVMAFVTTRTRYGRHLYAVGGNAEAARRAGIKVRKIRISVFVLASTFAAAGGILGAARLHSVGESSGGSDLLLLAIAGPVVAGVSLFGGRGFVWAALLGALIMGSISNGMDLLEVKSSTKFMVTGIVLLGAVTIDAATRRRRGAVMRA